LRWRKKLIKRGRATQKTYFFTADAEEETKAERDDKERAPREAELVPIQVWLQMVALVKAETGFPIFITAHNFILISSI